MFNKPELELLGEGLVSLQEHGCRDLIKNKIVSGVIEASGPEEAMKKIDSVISDHENQKKLFRKRVIQLQHKIIQCEDKLDVDTVAKG